MIKLLAAIFGLLFADFHFAQGEYVIVPAARMFRAASDYIMTFLWAVVP